MSRRLLIIGGRKPRDLALVGSMVIGRDPMCDVSEEDPLLSRRHAEFVAGAKEVVVRDLGSRNGILVNGIKRTRAVLHVGDLVQIGHLQVRFVEHAGPSLDRLELDSDGTLVASRAARDGDTTPANLSAVAASNGTGVASVIHDTRSDFERTLPIAHAPESAEFDRTVPSGKAPPAAASNELWDRSPIETQSLVLPGSGIRFEMPRHDWRVVPGGASTVLSLAQQQGHAAVVVERVRAGHMAGWSETADEFASNEAEVVRDQPASVTDVEARLVSLNSRRLVIVSYSRTGIAGLERVRQYSIAAGCDLYRLTCSAAASQFVRFEPIFAHVAATFAMGIKS